jgi:16S rRNA (guanine966-N2)-methyltransferase
MYIIAGSKKGLPLAAPKGGATRPTSARLRETVFNICQSYVSGARFLDLFAGSGAMGLEALSRGAKSCTFVDSTKESASAIKKNSQALGFENSASIVQGDVFAYLKRCASKANLFDIIFVDPPYAKEISGDPEGASFSDKVIELIDASQILASGGFLFIEDEKSAGKPLPTLATLQLISSRASGRATLLQYQKMPVT